MLIKITELNYDLLLIKNQTETKNESEIDNKFYEDLGIKSYMESKILGGVKHSW